MFHSLLSYRTEDGDELAVGRDSVGQHLLVFDGPGGRETVIRFDRVRIDTQKIVLEVADSVHAPTYVEAGSLEGQPQSFGAVGEWLEDAAQNHEVLA